MSVVEDPQWVTDLETTVDSAFTDVTKWSGEIIFFTLPGIPQMPLL